MLLSGAEPARKGKKLIHERFGETLMAFGVGMKPVSLRIAEILNLLFDHWVDATQRIHVNDRNSPYIPSLLDGLDILFKIKTDFVRERLIRLNVLLPESGICPVDRCENNNLLVREHTFKCADCNIDPTLQSRIVHHRSLRHPPEYEITVSDIQKISSCDVFVFAGFERMMKTLGTSVGNVEMVKIK